MCVLCSDTASAADEGKSLYDWLIEMYAEHAYYKEALINVTKKGQQGEQEIKAMMEKFRNNPPATINNSAVTRLLDYQTLTEKDLKSGNVTKPISQVGCDPVLPRRRNKKYLYVLPALNQKSNFISALTQSLLRRTILTRLRKSWMKKSKVLNSICSRYDRKTIHRIHREAHRSRPQKLSDEISQYSNEESIWIVTAE